MKTPAIFVFLIVSIVAQAQKPDTIQTVKGPIICFVKEVSPEQIAYSLPSETVVYKIEKGTVGKISFGNGRVEKVNELKNLMNLRGAEDWEKVNVATVEYETKGLYKIDLVSTKATGTTVYSSVSKVQDRAIHKLKMATALLGGNVVYMKNEAIEGNIRSNQGGRTSRAQITGVAYCSQLVDSVKFKELIGESRNFKLLSKIGLRNNDASIHSFGTHAQPVSVDSFIAEKGFIYLSLTIDGKKDEGKYQVTRFEGDNLIVALRDGTAIYNLLLRQQ